MLLRERALAPSSCHRGPPWPAAPTRGFSPKPLPAPCCCSGAGPLAGGPRCDPLPLVLAEHRQPTPASSLSLWHLHSWALSGRWTRAHEWGRVGDQDFQRLHSGPERGVGVRQGVGVSPFVSIWRALPPSAGGAVPPVWSPPGGGCGEGAALWPSLASLQTTDKVRLLMPGSPLPLDLPGRWWRDSPCHRRPSQQCIRARPCFSPGTTLCPASWTLHS